MNEIKALQRVRACLEGLGYPAESVRSEYRTRRGSHLDVVVVHGGRIALVVEVKRLDLLPREENLLPFDILIRQVQFAALEVSARYFILSDGDRFLWFETDTSGRPAKLPRPIRFDELATGQEKENALSEQIDIARSALRKLLERSREQRWSPEALPLILYAFLQSEQGDDVFLEILLNRSPAKSANLAPDPDGTSKTWFRAIHGFVVEQDSMGPQVYAVAVDVLLESGLDQLPPSDALQLIDDLLLKNRAWIGVSRLPRWTADLIVRVAGIRPGERVLDLNCGVGNIAAAIRLAGDITPADVTLFARHATDALWTAVQQLIFDKALPTILVGDPLVQNKSQTNIRNTMDCVLVVPPFGLGVRYPEEPWHQGGSIASEEAYLSKALDMVSSTGRVIALLPNGSLSSPAKIALREMMVSNGLRAVIDIGAFLQGSSAAVSIVVLDRAAPPSKEVFFANGQNRHKLDTLDCREFAGLSNILDRFNSWMLGNTASVAFEQGAALSAVAVPVDGALNAGSYLARLTQLRLPLASFEHLSLDSFAEITKGAAIRRSKGSGDVAFIAPGAIRPLEVNLDPLDRADELEVQRYANAVAKKGDVVLNGVSTYVAAAAVIESGEYPINRHVFRIRVDETRVIPDYLAIAINSRYVREALLASATGSIMRMLTLMQLKKVIIPIPPFSVQAEIVQRVNGAKKERDAAMNALQTKEASLLALVENLDSGDVV